jgi:hypothetical protein
MLKDHLKNAKLWKVVFQVYFISMPFSGYLFPIDCGSFTLFLALDALIILQYLFIKNFKKIPLWGFIVLGWIWIVLLYSIIFGLTKTFDIYVKNTLHDWLMWTLTIQAFIGVYLELGWKVTRRLIINGLVYFLLILIFFGLFEIFTGLHFESPHTELFNSPRDDNFFFAPVFIFANVNDYCLTFLGCLVLIWLLIKNKVDHTLPLLGGTLALLLLGYIASARLTAIAGVLFSTYLIISYLRKNASYFLKSNWGLIIFCLGCFVWVFFTAEFYSPNQMEIKSKPRIEIVNSAKTVIPEKKTEIDKEKKTEIIKEKRMSSYSIRKNLILNGIDFFLEKPLLGHGPGSFERLSSQTKGRRSTFNMINPHNFIINLLTQFGALGGLILLFAGVFIFQGIKKFGLFSSQAMELIVFCLIFILLSCIPANFTHLQLLWLGTIVFLLHYIENISKANGRI